MDIGHYSYYLRRRGESEWREVSREIYIQAERAAGFKPIHGKDYWKDLATGSFFSATISGRIRSNREPKKEDKT